jgi:hypothetical protein
MKKLLLMGLLVAISVGAPAADKAVGLAKIADDVRSGKTKVGKITNLAEEERFHNIHHKIVGIKCDGCHDTATYPTDHLYLRKDEFPKMVKGERVKAVRRATCIGCHSPDNVATVFYQKH